MPGVSEADFQALQDEVRALRAEVEGERPITDLKVQGAEERLDHLEEQRRLGLQREGERVARIKGLEDLTEEQSHLIRQLRTDLRAAGEAREESDRLAGEREGELRDRIQTLEALTREQGEKMEGDRAHIADLQAHARVLLGLTDRKAYLKGMGLGKFGGTKDKEWDCRGAAERPIGRADMETIVEGVNLTGIEKLDFRSNQLTPEALPPLLRLLRQPHAGGVRDLWLGGNRGLLVAGGLGGGEGEGRGLPPTLTRLTLWGCGLTRESLLALLRPGVLPPGLTFLNLSENDPALSEVGVMEALGALEGGPPLSLTTLNVQRSGATTEGIAALKRLRPQLTLVQPS